MEFNISVASDGQLYSSESDSNAQKVAELLPEWVDVKANGNIFWKAYTNQGKKAFWDAMFNAGLLH